MMAKHTQQDLDAILSSARKKMEKTFSGPLLESQRKSLVEPPVRSTCWVSRTTFPPPVEDDVRKILIAAIEDLGVGAQLYPFPEFATVPVQWVGHRSGMTNAAAPEPEHLTEREKFDALTAEAGSDRTIIYIHGGAYSMNNPSSRRPTAATLSRLTRSRICLVSYRLAPQFPFPSQILDVLVAYFSLLHPPMGSFHAPVPASSLVLAGDSSGATLALSVIQILLSRFRRESSLRPCSSAIGQPKVLGLRFHGLDRGGLDPGILPAGVAVQSPHLDTTTRSLPSAKANVNADFLLDKNPTIDPSYKFDKIWPASPPRVHVYCESAILAHPLVSPCLAEGKNWRGSPPVYFAIGGGERLLDAAKVVAQGMARNGVEVGWDEYERMPHNWPMVLKGWRQTDGCYERWAQEIAGFFEKRYVGKDAATGMKKSWGRVTGFEGKEGGAAERQVDVENLSDLTEDQARMMVGEGIKQLERDAEAVMKIWTRDAKGKETKL